MKCDPAEGFGEHPLLDSQIRFGVCDQEDKVLEGSMRLIMRVASTINTNTMRLAIKGGQIS